MKKVEKRSQQQEVPRKNDHKILLTKNFKTKNCNIHKLQKVII
ncbi:hypothetical protein HPCPY6311_1536 [Helicobacter pylori CPY6311]|nr:hypothetical protein HPCPY6311_1536 [Helicobacter pylori CPY6311]